MSKKKKKAPARTKTPKAINQRQVYPKNQKKSSVQDHDDKEIPTAGLVLPCGGIVELVKNTKKDIVDFILHNPNGSSIQNIDKITAGSKIYVPPVSANIMCTIGFGTRSGAVLLPTGPIDYGSVSDLVDEIRFFIHKYVELDEKYELIAAYYVLFTWVFDRFDEVPYLRFFTYDYGSGKSRALETIGSICYRPIFLGGSSTSASMRRMIDAYRGTIVADEQDSASDNDLTTSYTKMLNQGFQRGKPIIVCDQGNNSEPRGFDVFGPKVLVTRTKFNDKALESRFITIFMRQRTRKDIPLNLPRKDFDKSAIMLRNKLLKFRFDYFHKTTLNSSLVIPNVQDRMNQIMVPLLSVIPDECKQEDLISHITDLDRELKDDQSDSIEADIVRYLSEQWENYDRDIYVGDVSKGIHTMDSEENLIRPLTARKAGQIIRDRLCFKTAKDRNGRRVLKDLKRLSELKSKYGLGGDLP